jgi:hypothetical protein
MMMPPDSQPAWRASSAKGISWCWPHASSTTPEWSPVDFLVPIPLWVVGQPD